MGLGDWRWIGSENKIKDLEYEYVNTILITFKYFYVIENKAHSTLMYLKLKITRLE